MDNQHKVYDLARRAKDGDQDALAELVEYVRPGLFSVAHAMLGHYQNAQDAVAEAIFQICLHFAALREEWHVGGWMLTIVRNEARKILHLRHTTDPLIDDLAAPDDDSGRSLRLDIESALRLLPRDKSRTIALFYLGGVSIQEIARRTSRPIGTIKRWLHEGRRYLALELEAYAPMKRTLVATLFTTDLPANTVDGLRAALTQAGYDKVNVMDELPALERFVVDESVEFRLPQEIADTSFAILDEQVGGRSAFELYAILKASSHSKDMASGILFSRPSQNTIFAAWAAGFDLCLNKDDLDMNQFREYCSKISTQIKE